MPSAHTHPTPQSPRRGPRGVRVLAVSAALALGGALAAAGPLAGSAGAATALVPGTPCHIGTAACVQLGRAGFNARSWFIRDHQVVKGPVHASTGGPGMDTSTGTFKVVSKDRSHKSSETTDSEGNPSDMPYSVFFGGKGEAFHGGGNPNARTAGCVRLTDSDASYFFSNLKPGDQVEIVSSSAGAAPGDADSDSSDDSDDSDNSDDYDDSDGDSSHGILPGL